MIPFIWLSQGSVARRKRVPRALFNNPSLERQTIEVAEFDTNSAVAKLSSDLQLNVESTLWGRRSIFVLENKPLMVAEVFLPDAFAYQQNVNSDCKNA